MPAVALLPFFPTCYHRVNPISPSPSFARRASPAFHPSASQPSFLSAFQIDGFTKEGQRGRTEGTETDIYVRVLGKGKKRKKKRGKQVKRLCRLCLTYTLVQNRGFVYFFPASPSQSVHAPESSLQQAKFSMKFSWPGRGGCPRSRSTRRRIQKKRGLVCESRLRGYKPGWGRVQRKIRRAIFKRNERCLKFTLQVSRRGVGKRGVRFSREHRHKRYLLHFVNITNSMFQRRPILCSFS